MMKYNPDNGINANLSMLYGRNITPQTCSAKVKLACEALGIPQPISKSKAIAAPMYERIFDYLQHELHENQPDMFEDEPTGSMADTTQSTVKETATQTPQATEQPTQPKPKGGARVGAGRKAIGVETVCRTIEVELLPVLARIRALHNGGVDVAALLDRALSNV
jgi:hypothetical protein